MRTIDPAQLGEWFDAYGTALVLYARQWLETGQAEDVVQDTFIRLLAQSRRPDRPRAWLFRCVRNAAIAALRSRRRRESREAGGAAKRPAWFESRPGDLIDAATAQQALADLPPEQREPVVLRIWASMTLAEIAETLGEPVSTVFSRYKAGLATVRERMERACRSHS